MDFHSLPISAPVLEGIDALGFTECTPIQEKTLPLLLAGKDLAGQAQTGTGKTAAFLTTIFTHLLTHPRDADTPGRPPRALIVAPTRELTVQIFQDAEAIGQFTDVEIHAVFGGIDYAKQREKLRDGCDILVGTPGRLIDYFKQRALKLSQVELLVIDEADRMFDMGFIADLRYLLRRLPRYDERQSMLFSATLNWDVMELAYEHMNEPTKVVATPEQIIAENVEHMLYHVGVDEKFPLLLGLFHRETPTRALVFTNMKREARWVADRLDDNGFHARALTGDLEQRMRLKLMRQFKAGELPILVATDVASRGLHIEGVTHIFNWDLPMDAEDYVHRIGRTARAGASGRALTLACERYVGGLEAVEAFIGFKLPATHVDDSLLVKPAPRRKRRQPSESAPRARRAGQTPRGRPSGTAPRGQPSGTAPRGRPSGTAPRGRRNGRPPSRRRRPPK